MESLRIACMATLGLTVAGCAASTSLSEPQARYAHAYQSYVDCIDPQVAPRLRDLAAAGVPITRERIEAVVEDAHRGCGAEALATFDALRGISEYASMSNDEGNLQLKAVMVGVYVSDRDNGIRCWGTMQQYC